MLHWLKRIWHWVRGTGATGLTDQLWARIEQHGWTGMYVGDYRTAPTWSYSIGFSETLDQPEVIIFDLPQEAANALLWEAFSELKDGRLKLEDGKVWAEAGDKPCVWRKVHPSQLESEAGWLTFASLRSLVRRGTPFGLEAFQLVLSDNDGRLPWESGYDERLRPLQPSLYEPLEGEATSLATGRAM